ncbi:hypothetical protein [Pseudaestuariivita sp.]|uniref:hypothetical protein n=1 Tax=Pseudaestuariivita sp. TaxID=2211669 RepID=UPI00405A2B7F
MPRVLVAALALLIPLSVSAQEAPEPPMTIPRMIEIVQAVDPDARPRGNGVEFTIADVPVLIIADPSADRMRAMVPIRSAAGLEDGELRRLMQANFDTALDARYAIAQGRVWGVYIHPLSPLQKNQLLSGLAQTVAVAQTYGTLYSGGAAIFGGGDSNDIYRDLLDELIEKGEDI